MARILTLVGLGGLTWREVPLMVMLSASLLIMVDGSLAFRREHEPVEAYYEVKQLDVPDFIQGEDPVITFDRVVRREFNGRFVAELRMNGTLQPVFGCVGSATVNYTPDKKLPVEGPRLSWFLWLEPGQCSPPVGAYFLHACWNIDRLRASPARYCATSRLFNVLSKEVTR